VITRIPQPQFVGPAPAEVVQQAGATGQKWGDLIAQGIQEGMQSYQADKQLKQQQSQLQAASEQLRIQLMAKDFSDKMSISDDPGKTFQENAETYKQLALFYAKGDKDAANQIYEKTAEQFLNNMAPTNMAKGGMFSISANPTPAQGQATTPATAPQPAPSAPPTQTQAGAPATMPNANPIAAPQVAPTLNHPLPTTPQEVGNLSDTLSENTNLMNAYRQYLIASGETGVVAQGNPAKDKALLSKSGNQQSFVDFVSKLKPDDITKLVGVASTPEAQKAAEASNTAITMTSGMSGSLKTTASEAVKKVLTGDATDQVTPKESVALNQAVKYTVQVLSDSQPVKEFLSAGGSTEALQRGAQQLQEWMNSDPEAVKYLQTSYALPTKQAKEYMDMVKQDETFVREMQLLGIDMTKTENAGIVAHTDALRAATAWQALAEKSSNNDKKLSDAEYKEKLASYDATMKAYSDQYQKEVASYRTTHKGISDYDVSDHMYSLISTPGNNIYELRKQAAYIGSALTGQEPKMIELQLATTGGLLNTGLFAKPAKTYSTYGIPSAIGSTQVEPGVTQAQASAQTPAPTSATAQPNKGLDYMRKTGILK
jgi:hypothetical protein